MKGLISIGAIVLLLGMWVGGLYNSLVYNGVAVDTAWAQVETQYQRRFDLVPNLVESAKGVMRQEQEVFGAIAEARTHYAGTNVGSPERVEATERYESALARLMVIMENYPELRSTDVVQGLMDELAGTENRINVSRDRYNETVRVYNFAILRFPTNFMAGMLHYEQRPYFEIEEGVEEVPDVELRI